MRPARPFVPLLLGAAALLLLGLPAGAAPGQPRTGSTVTQSQALTLLGTAARAARARAWSGTQAVSTWHDGSPSSEVVELRHDPGRGTEVRSGTEQAWTSRTPAMDGDLLARLADSYALAVVGAQRCSGRSAQVVEARRPGGRLAARFFVDGQTGLPLGREVWDAAGTQLSSSRFVSLTVGPETGSAALVRPVALDRPVVGSDWPAPAQLPGGFRLFDASRPLRDGAAVQHLAYSDGLATVSVFSQPGVLGSLAGRGYTQAHLGRTTVWVQAGVPERVVWSGGGQVFTVVSDAGHADVLAVVAVLPRDRAAATGVSARLHRGLSRLGAALGVG